MYGKTGTRISFSLQGESCEFRCKRKRRGETAVYLCPISTSFLYSEGNQDIEKGEASSNVFLEVVWSDHTDSNSLRGGGEGIGITYLPCNLRRHYASRGILASSRRLKQLYEH